MSLLTDKDQQGQKNPVADAKRQEFRVTKPTPLLLETPTVHVAKPPSSSSESSTSSQPPSQDVRPPSPVSAPPKRKKSGSSTSSSPRGDQTKPSVARDLPTVVTKPSTDSSVVIKPTPVVPEKDVVVRTAAAETVGVSQQTSAPAAQAPVQDASPKQESDSVNVDDSTVVSGPDSAAPEMEKPTSVVLEAPPDDDRRPQSVQREIRKEVATDTKHKDAPQLMKIKKLDSLKAIDVSDRRE